MTKYILDTAETYCTNCFHRKVLPFSTLKQLRITMTQPTKYMELKKKGDQRVDASILRRTGNATTQEVESERNLGGREEREGRGGTRIRYWKGQKSSGSKIKYKHVAVGYVEQGVATRKYKTPGKREVQNL